VTESGDRIIAERRILGTPHDWQIIFLRQLNGRPWTARLTQRLGKHPLSSTGRAYMWGTPHSSPDLHTLADIGLWVGGVMSEVDPQHEPPKAA
jgi:hypothetical protein